MAKKLTAKQKAFVLEYLVDLDGAKSARRAGYSAKTANVRAAQLLAMPHVQEAVAKAMAARAKRTEITQDAVVKELARIAFGDPRDVMEWGPNGVRLKASGDLSDDDVAQVAEVSETVTKDGGSLKLKTNDKIRALELLGKHMGMFTNKHELTGPKGQPLPPPEITITFVEPRDDEAEAGG